MYMPYDGAKGILLAKIWEDEIGKSKTSRLL